MTPTQAREDRIEDVSENSIIFLSKKRGLTTQVAENVADATLEETMQGASDLSVEMRDSHYVALNSGLFADRFYCTIDKTTFRFVEVSLVSQYLLHVSFEHRLIAEMREHTGNVKAIRGKVTRAEFIQGMLKELKLPHRFICPELHRTQKTPAPELIKEEHEERSASEQVVVPNLEGAGRGPGLTAGKLKIESTTATQAQLDEASTLLRVAEEESPGNERLFLAILCAGMGESTLSKSSDNGTYWGVLQAKHGVIPKDDTAQMAHYFCVGGKGYKSAIELAKIVPLTPGGIAEQAEGSGAGAAHYDRYRGDAEAMLAAWKGHEGGGTHTVTVQGSSQTVATVRTATFEFSRGKPGEPEDTYTCALRLAEEVGWRFFVVGSGDIYFVNDDDLLRARPRYTIEPGTVGLMEDPTFDVEVGNRTVIERGRRVPKPSEAEVKIRANRYAAPPGTVVLLQGYGPADGKWLVDTVERSLYDAGTTVHLRAPQKPLEEPQATESTSERTSAQQASAELGQSGTANRSVEKKLASEHPELRAAVRKVLAVILTQFPSLAITSTTGGNHAPDSYHFKGMAADLAGPNMDAIGTWIAKNLGGLLTEGIHNPTLSVKDGKAVNGPSFYADVWEGHKDHIHIAVAG